MKGISLVKVLEKHPEKQIFVKYENKKERQMEVFYSQSYWTVETQVFRSRNFEWIAAAYEGTPYLFGYGIYDWLILSCRVPGKMENKLLKQYSGKLYSNSKLRTIGVEMTPELLDLLNSKVVKSFLPYQILVKAPGNRLAIASLEGNRYKYDVVEPNDFFVCGNVIPVVKLPKDTLVNASIKDKKPNKIWLPTVW